MLAKKMHCSMTIFLTTSLDKNVFYKSPSAMKLSSHCLPNLGIPLILKKLDDSMRGFVGVRCSGAIGGLDCFSTWLSASCDEVDLKDKDTYRNVA